MKSDDCADEFLDEFSDEILDEYLDGFTFKLNKGDGLITKAGDKSTFCCRLVLKIYSYVKYNQLPSLFKVTDPYVTASNEGHIIWSGTVGLEEKIFEWICFLGKDVEILSPSAFKIAFKKYCLKKLAPRQHE